MRRQAAAAGVAAVPAFPGAAGVIERASRPTDILRVGVIGVRGRGRAHVGAFKRSADSEVVAICDPDEAVIDGAMTLVKVNVVGQTCRMS